MRNLVILTLCVMITGCYTPKKAANQANKIQSTFPEIMARYCGLWYPIMADTSENTWFVPGVAERDTLTIRDTFTRTIYKYITQTVHDTIKTSKTITKESTAKLEEQRIGFEKRLEKKGAEINELNKEVSKQKAKAEEYEDKFKTWRHRFIVLACVVGAILILIVLGKYLKSFVRPV